MGLKLSGSRYTCPVVNAATVVAFGLLAGTGGIVDASYLAKRQGRGYQFVQFDNVPVAAAAAEKSPSDDLARIRETLKPTVSELAKVFGVSRQTIYNWQAGEVPSAENASRLQGLANVAQMFMAEGMSVSSEMLRRKMYNVGSILDAVRGGGDIQEAGRVLVQVMGKEAHQQRRLEARLAGRNTPNIAPADYGISMLNDKD